MKYSKDTLIWKLRLGSFSLQKKIYDKRKTKENKKWEKNQMD